jgi:hypothetical protein
MIIQLGWHRLYVHGADIGMHDVVDLALVLTALTVFRPAIEDVFNVQIGHTVCV